VQKFTSFAKSQNGGKIKTLVTDPKQLAFLIPNMFGAVLYFCRIFS
jgi:hypothetical protein